ncbi:unnamed protein product [Zymoseptoria tritici ST99CH_1A5]|uniref:Uncharacterized protein n=1 Tax=Zymoseptoria tritici ST99CH_1A5 TaxID=1276529 RepID=A0A1Y6LL89_ZYMTR|nr:unnamed protein product [Zymoseptoria tritici ST99CH_1A5]
MRDDPFSVNRDARSREAVALLKKLGIQATRAQVMDPVNGWRMLRTSNTTGTQQDKPSSLWDPNDSSFQRLDGPRSTRSGTKSTTASERATMGRLPQRKIPDHSDLEMRTKNITPQLLESAPREELVEKMNYIISII